MNRYKSHKEVEAFKIVNMRLDTDKGDVTRLLGNEDIAVVDRAYMDKHKPQAGGYYVRYADGYESWSPADAFEEGYTKVEDV